MAWAVTALVDTVTVAAVAFGPKEAVAGTIASAALLLTSETLPPRGGASPVRVSLRETFEPPFTEAGAGTTVESSAGSTVILLGTALFPNVAMIETAVLAATPDVDMIKLAVGPEIGTVAGAEAAEGSLDTSPIVELRAGAPFRPTVPATLPPPTTIVVATTKDFRAGGLTKTWEETAVEPRLAVTVTVTDDRTGWLEAVNKAFVPPAAIWTDAGTVMSGLFELRETTLPEGPAGPVRVTDPVVVSSGTRDAAERVTAETVAVFTVTFAVFRIPGSV